MGRDPAALRARRELRTHRAAAKSVGFGSYWAPPKRRRRPPPRRYVVLGALLVIGLGPLVGVTATRRRPLDASLAGTQTPSSGAPVLRIPTQIAPSTPGFVSTLRGLVDATSSLTADGESVALEPGGAFSVHILQGEQEVRL